MTAASELLDKLKTQRKALVAEMEQTDQAFEAMPLSTEWSRQQIARTGRRLIGAVDSAIERARELATGRDDAAHQRRSS